MSELFGVKHSKENYAWFEEGKRLGAKEDAKFWVDFFKEWKSVEFDKEQRIVIEHSLEVAEKRLRELEELGK